MLLIPSIENMNALTLKPITFISTHLTIPDLAYLIIHPIHREHKKLYCKPTKENVL